MTIKDYEAIEIALNCIYAKDKADRLIGLIKKPTPSIHYNCNYRMKTGRHFGEPYCKVMKGICKCNKPMQHS